MRHAQFGGVLVFGLSLAACGGPQPSSKGEAADAAKPAKPEPSPVAKEAATSGAEPSAEESAEATTGAGAETTGGEAAPPGEADGPAFDPAAALAMVHTIDPPERTDEGLSEVAEPIANAAVFKSGDKTVGAAWYEARAGKVDLGVLVSSELESDQHDYALESVSTFKREGEAWKLVVTQPIYEDAGDEFATVPELVELGGGAHGLLHGPITVGCGAEDCTPEDDWVDNTVVELGAAGVREVWRWKGPRCSLGAEAPYPGSCGLSVAGAKPDARGELEAHVREGDAPKRLRFAWGDERYAERK